VSITNAGVSKIELGRVIPLPDAVREFTGDDDERLKWLVALHLSGQGWTYTLLGRVFGYDRGHVCRECNRVLDELAAKPADCP